MDEFGGIPVEEQDSDEFGGIAIAEPPAEPKRLNTAQYVAGGGPMAGMALIPSPSESPTAPFVPLPRINIPGELGNLKANLLQGIVAPYNVAAGLVEGTESPLGVGTMALGPIGKVGQAAIGAGFGVPAMVQGAKQVYKGTALGEPQQALEGALQVGAGGAMTAGGLKAIELPPNVPRGTEPITLPKAPPLTGEAREFQLLRENWLPTIKPWRRQLLDSEVARGDTGLAIDSIETNFQDSPGARDVTRAKRYYELARKLFGRTGEEVAPIEPPPIPPPGEPPVKFLGNKATAPWPEALVSKSPTGDGWRLTWFSKFEGKLDPRGHSDYPTKESAVKAAREMDFEEVPSSGEAGEAKPSEAPVSAAVEMTEVYPLEVISKLPPPKPGFVRLYRGGTKGKEGLWFSDNDEVGAFHYENHSYDRPSTLSYIDVPKADAEKYSEAAFEHPDVKSKKTIAESGDHVLPKSLADKATVVIDSGKVISDKPPTPQAIAEPKPPVVSQQAPKPVWEMNEDEFVAAGAKGKVHKATGKPTPGTPTQADTPISIGEREGYSPEDIARFYLQRRGMFRKKLADSEILGAVSSAYEEMLHDASLEGKSPKSPTPVGQATSVTPPVTEPSKGIAGSVRTKWTTATEPLGSEAGFISLDPIKELVDKATPYVKGAYNFVRELGGEESKITRLNDYGKSVLNWSAKLQRSFGEAASAQKEIATKVPDPVRREGITNWIQADGDANVLAQRAAATVDPKLKKGYEAALTLTPEEIAVANDVRNAYQTLGQRGSLYDVLNHFKDNYVTQIWDLGKVPTFSGARTLQDKFRFDKASTFPTFFDGEQAGYTPKTKDISKLLPVYLHEMNSVISARQLVEQMSNGVASDGRPLVSPRGAGAVVDGPKGKATLITPKSIKGDTLDYRVIPNQPALTDWTWKTKDASGNPVFMKSDLALHPEAYDKLKNVLGRSAIREWYSTRTSAAAQIPKLLVKGLDMANSETKRTMLGLLAPFHQVQEGTHGVGHRVNPTFNIPKIDLVNNAAQMDAARHGLMLAPDRASSEQFMEGFRTSGLISKIPGIGPLADHYSNYLFHDYIPGLKYKTYDAILNRNQHVYAKDLASGAVSLADVKHLSAEQANAAYGHLNYADLARNPTIQHIMQLGILAPDFFEARARFTGQAIKGLTGGKVGREQLLALATLAVAQAATAYTSAKLTGGQWDPGRPFEFHVGNRRYTMRSVPEDVSSVLHDARAFAFSRISPIIGKGILQYLTGTDYRGQKISAGETTKELFQQPIPISIRGFVGLGRQSLSGWEQLASAVGLRISRYSPTSEAFDMARSWMKESSDPKTQKRLEVQQHSVFPESEYKPLRNALNDDNMNAAKAAYAELLKTKTPTQIYRAMSHPHPFTGKATDEVKFVRSLNEEQKAIYDQAVRERKNTLNKFIQMRNQ